MPIVRLSSNFSVEQEHIRVVFSGEPGRDTNETGGGNTEHEFVDNEIKNRHLPKSSEGTISRRGALVRRTYISKEFRDDVIRVGWRQRLACRSEHPVYPPFSEQGALGVLVLKFPRALSTGKIPRVPQVGE